MIEPNIYCKVSGMVMSCIRDSYVRSKKLPTVIEIGCADGQGTMRFAGFCERVICIDPMVAGRPDLDRRKKVPLDKDQEKIKDFQRRNKEFNVELIEGCSLWDETVEEVTRKLDGKKVDILVVDGCHHPFEAVWGDFVTYYQFVKKDGFIIFDDLYEECIRQAYEKALSDFLVIPHEHWEKKEEGILQEVVAIQKIGE